MIPEELNNTEFLELKQEHRAEEEAEKETAEQKKNPSKEIHSAGFSSSFWRPQQAP